MRIRLLLPLGILLSLPALAHAAAVSPPGVNIRWDRCFADGGAWNRTFACNTNTGSDALVLSFELDTTMTDVSALEIVVDLASASPVLPAWWNLRNPGTCRVPGVSLSMSLPAGSANCDAWAPESVTGGGIAAYNIGFNGPQTARLLAAVGVPNFALATLSAGQEYFAASLVINHSKTVGADACAGCDVPVCILFQSLRVTTPDAVRDRLLLHGANWQGSQIAYWQNGYAANFAFSCNEQGRFCRTTFTCVPYDVTRSTPSTWGAVKSLYR